MGKLFVLEFEKVKKSFLTILIPMVFLGPIVMVYLGFTSSKGQTFYDVVVKESVFIQMIPFAIVVLSGCYILGREYKDNMWTYLNITSKSPTKIILCKIGALCLETIVLQLLTFVVLLLMNSVLEPIDAKVVFTYIKAAVMSSLLMACLVPAIVFITLIKREVAASAIIILIIYMFTFPFIFQDYGYMFPHLLPLVVVIKIFGSDRYVSVNYLIGSGVMVLLFFIFLILSLHKIKKIKY